MQKNILIHFFNSRVCSQSTLIRIAYGHVTDSFWLKFSFIRHLQHTFCWVYVIFVDIFTWQYIYCCATVNVEFHRLFIDKHLCINFLFRDAVNSFYHCWLRCYTVQEFSPLDSLSSTSTLWVFSLAEHWEVILYATRSPQTAPSCTVGSALSMFSSTENTWLISRKHPVIIRFLVCMLPACLLSFVFVSTSSLHFMGILCRSLVRFASLKSKLLYIFTASGPIE